MLTNLLHSLKIGSHSSLFHLSMKCYCFFTDEIYPKVYHTCFFIVTYFAPLCLMVLAYIQICHKLWCQQVCKHSFNLTNQTFYQLTRLLIECNTFNYKSFVSVAPSGTCVFCCSCKVLPISCNVLSLSRFLVHRQFSRDNGSHYSVPHRPQVPEIQLKSEPVLCQLRSNRLKPDERQLAC